MTNNKAPRNANREMMSGFVFKNNPTDALRTETISIMTKVERSEYLLTIKR